MKTQIYLKAGDEDSIVNRNAFTELGQILLLPLSLITQFLILGLIVLLDLFTLGTLHIRLDSRPKKYRRPDGTIVDPSHLT